MSSRSIALFQAHRAGTEPPFDPRDRIAQATAGAGAVELLAHAQELEALARKLRHRAAELRTTASIMMGSDLP